MAGHYFITATNHTNPATIYPDHAYRALVVDGALCVYRRDSPTMIDGDNDHLIIAWGPGHWQQLNWWEDTDAVQK